MSLQYFNTFEKLANPSPCTDSGIIQVNYSYTIFKLKWDWT